jgi:hypothetical protein
VGTAPALAKDTTSAKPTGEAEEAATTRPKVLMSWTQDKAMHGHEVKMPLQEGKHMHKSPPEALPRKGKCKPEVPP